MSAIVEEGADAEGCVVGVELIGIINPLPFFDHHGNIVAFAFISRIMQCNDVPIIAGILITYEGNG